MTGISSKSAGKLENRFKVTGKELQHLEFNDGTGLEEYDFGARFLDPQIGRWHSIDPLSESSRRWSTYSYDYNNPIRFIDPDGMYAMYASTEQEEKDLYSIYGSTKTIEYNDLDKGDITNQNKESNAEVISENSSRNDPKKPNDKSKILNEVKTEFNDFMHGKGTVYKGVDFFNRNINPIGLLVHGSYEAATGEDLLTSEPTSRTGGVAKVLAGGLSLFGSALLKNAASIPATRVFWSGGEIAKNTAMNFAKENGMKTLEMTFSGKTMNYMNSYMPRFISNPIWKALSSNFANGATGEVYFFTSHSGPSASSIWMNVEQPILKENLNRIIVNKF